MTITKQIRQDIQRYFGGRGGLRKHRTGFFRDLTNPDKLGLFFCIQSKGELDEIRQLLSRLGQSQRKAQAIVFFQGSGSLDVITHKSIFMFSLDDFSLFGKKKESLQQKFDRDRYDLLISFTFSPDPFCKRMVSDLHADFKAGPEHPDGDDLYDLMIGGMTKNKSINGFYDQVERYLKMLNVKNQ